MRGVGILAPSVHCEEQGEGLETNKMEKKGGWVGGGEKLYFCKKGKKTSWRIFTGDS